MALVIENKYVDLKIAKKKVLFVLFSHNLLQSYLH